jgi:hypothetical protein
MYVLSVDFGKLAEYLHEQGKTQGLPELGEHLQKGS